MAGTCAICERGRNVANNRSKSKVATKRTQKMNLQKFKIAGLSKWLCTRCIRTMNKSLTFPQGIRGKVRDKQAI